MKISFKRIISSGNFIPEIDGLRFIAIVSIVLFHLAGFITEKDKYSYENTFNIFPFLKRLILNGDVGVPLFFVISGFILGLPFAKYYLNKGNVINLKKYFLRRLTRLEPPYIIIMTILFFGAVSVAKIMSFSEAVKSYLASIFYSHNFIYGRGSLLNGPAWSLEIEVQFYLLAPVMAYLFMIKMPLLRRSLMVLIILFYLVIDFSVEFPFRTIMNYMHFFLIGFLLADLYVTKPKFLPKSKFDTIIGLFLFIIIFYFERNDFDLKYNQFLWEIIQLSSIFFLYYYILFHKIFRFLSFRIITNIGGMCYSIYLVHYPIISMFGNPLLKYKFSESQFINISIYSMVLIFLILVISSIFFLTIERPCMDKDWYKKIFNKLK